MLSLSPKRIFVAGLAVLALALTGAVVGLLVTSSGGSSGLVRSLALQPTDVPPEFVLIEEKLYSREELLAKLAADAQTGQEMLGELYADHRATEEGLKDAVHLTYKSEEDVPVVDVWVYTYEDEAAAEAAHAFARATDLERLRPLELGNAMRGYMMPVPAGLELEGMGDAAALMTGAIDDYDDGEEITVGDALTVQVYFMYSGSARAEVRVAGESLLIEPEAVARNQYLRLEGPSVVIAPQNR